MTSIIIPRSEVTNLYSKRYEVQQQAPTGNWYTVIGTDDEKMAIEYADDDAKTCHTPVRIIDNVK